MTVCGRRLLIVEDEPLLRVAISDALRKEGWVVDVAEDGEKGARIFEKFQHDLVLSDLVMPRMDGMELLRKIKALAPQTTMVIISAHGSVDRAVEAMRYGAADFIAKPFSMAQLKVRLDNVCSVRQLREQNVRLQEQLEKRHSFSKIVGKSKKMQRVFDLIKIVSDSDSSVLVHGESGTGKEMVANAIHYNSPRRVKPYLKVSCASLPETLIESELFGYEKGSVFQIVLSVVRISARLRKRPLFLDEISELPLTFQVKLLRVLQERQIERLGSNRPLDVDVRVVSASLRPLEEEIGDGRFREDLYFRINTVSIQIPPLRDRREDVPLLAQTFLQEFCRERGKQIDGFSDDVLNLFDGYSWPGNVRELRNVVERAVLFCSGPRVTVEELPSGMRGPAGRRAAEPASGPLLSLHQASEKAEIEAIRAALQASGGRRTVAAKSLGISRKTLWEKIKNYGIAIES